MRRRLASKSQRVLIYLRQGGKCALCGEDLEETFAPAERRQLREMLDD